MLSTDFERMTSLKLNPYAGTAKQVIGAQIKELLPSVTQETPSYLVQRGSGFTVVSTDWDDDFDANPNSVYESDYSTKSGSVHLTGFTTNDPVRCVVCFDSDRAGSVTGRLLLSAGNVQTKMNGTITNYAASATVTLTLVEGRNVFRIAHDGTAGNCVLDIRIFDGKDFRWVDIRRGFGV